MATIAKPVVKTRHLATPGNSGSDRTNTRMVSTTSPAHKSRTVFEMALERLANGTQSKNSASSNKQQLTNISSTKINRNPVANNRNRQNLANTTINHNPVMGSNTHSKSSKSQYQQQMANSSTMRTGPYDAPLYLVSSGPVASSGKAFAGGAPNFQTSMKPIVGSMNFNPKPITWQSSVNSGSTTSSVPTQMLNSTRTEDLNRLRILHNLPQLKTRF